MERDFLGITGMDSRGLAGDDIRGGRQDSAMQWPFSNKISARQHLMSLKIVPEDKPEIDAFDHLSSSGFQPIATKGAFETSYKASDVKEAPQRCFSLDRQNASYFSVHGYQPQSNHTFGASNSHVVSHPSIPVSTSNPFFMVHGSSNAPNHHVTSLKQHQFGGFAVNNRTVVGSSSGPYVQRNISKTTTSPQLTIFYAGSVNVYDDVPWDKAQAVMLLASKACRSTSNAPNQRTETHVSSPVPKVAVVSGLSAGHSPAQMLTQTHTHNPTISVTSHIGAQARSSSSNANNVVESKNVGPLPPALIQHEPSKVNTTSATILPRAVPQARKASLARFLEKRKERVTNTMPYSCAKKSPEDSAGFEGVNASSKCSSADLSLLSNPEESWCSAHPKNSIDDMDSLGTDLQM